MLLLAAFGIAFIVTAVIGKPVIAWLRKLKMGQKILDIGPAWHKSKEGTPAMGGIMFMVGILIAVGATGWVGASTGDWRAFLAMIPAYAFGFVGMIDDVAKRFHGKNQGLSVIQKLVLQIAVAAIFIVILNYTGYLSTSVYIPFFNVTFDVPYIVYIIIAALYIVFMDNAVNLTDGIDGLASGVTIPVMLFFALAASLTASGTYAEAGLPAAATAGALVGFLIYNFHPAKVFMGDTGSLFLGGMVCGLAFACDMPLIMIVVGLVYIIEALSSVLQVIYFKLTHGKRLFKMAPIHHHFEKCGWSEVKIFTVFTTVTVILCAIAYLGVMSR